MIDMPNSMVTTMSRGGDCEPVGGTEMTCAERAKAASCHER